MRDANKQALAFVYCEDEPGRRATAKLLTRAEARRTALNIAKVPELLRRPQRLRCRSLTLTGLGPIRQPAITLRRSAGI